MDKSGDTLAGIAQHYAATAPVFGGSQPAVHNPALSHARHQLRVIESDLSTALVHHASSGNGHSAPVKSYQVTAAPASAPAQSAQASTGSGYDSSDLADIPGVPHAYAACVAYRESTNNTNPAAHGNAYGIIPASGYNVGGESIAQQKQVFKQIYDTTGPRAWAADGC